MDLPEPLAVVDGRYELLRPLGHGATGTTWRAKRLADGVEVALKERLLARWGSFHELDRSRREAALLSQLSHPGIAAHLDSFLVEAGRHTAFYLALELVEGAPLALELTGRRRGWRHALLDLAGLLDILAYLHGLSPAVVHADVTPQNLLRRADNGGLVLVDFHAARTSPEERAPGLTTALGTPGFVAPEQLGGRAEPKTDVYAAACVALSLLTRRPLHALVDEDHRLRWRGAVSLPLEVERLLERMLEPALARRAGSAKELAAEARSLASGQPRAHARRPANATLALALGAGSLGAGWLATRLAPAEPRPPAPVDAPSQQASLGEPAPLPIPFWDSSRLVGPAPEPVPFPDVPGSACAARGDCLRLGRGAFFDRARAACSAADPDPAAKSQAFTAPIAGMTSFCQARHVGGSCAGGCTLRFRQLRSEVFQQRAEDVAQALRDTHGRARSDGQWKQRERPKPTLTRAWRWGQPGPERVDLTVSAEWRPVPPESQAPTDVHVDFVLYDWPAKTAKR